MKFQLGRKASDVFVMAYLLATLLLRFVFEPQINGHYALSIGIGLFALLFLWALKQSGFINPVRMWFSAAKG